MRYGLKCYSVLMGIHHNFKAIIAALDQNSNRIIDIFIVVDTPTSNSALEYIYNNKKVTHGPSCSRASQQNGNLKILKPQPFNLARWTSALPSSKLNGRPMNESFSFSLPLDLSFPPSSSSIFKLSSTPSQNPSFFQLSWPSGLFEPPDKFTPRSSTVRPVLSTNWQSIVWIRLGFGDGNGWGVEEWGIEDIFRKKGVWERWYPGPTRSTSFIGRTTFKLIVWLYLAV